MLLEDAVRAKEAEGRAQMYRIQEEHNKSTEELQVRNMSIGSTADPECT